MKLQPSKPQLHARGAVVRRSIHRERARAGDLRRQPPAVRVAHVEHAHCRHRRSTITLRGGHEQPPLGLEVLLHVRVEVQVVLGQVREDRRREGDRIDAPELKRMRGHLHRACLIATVEHRAQVRLQLDRLRGRAGHRTLLTADHRLDRAQQSAPAGTRFQQRPHQVCSSRLAVGPRHPHHRQLACRLAVEARRHRRHRRTRRLHQHLRHAHAQPPLHHQRRRARPHRLHREVVAVSAKAAHAEEQIPRPHHAAVIGQAGDLHASRLARRLGSDQPVQSHALMLLKP